VLELMISMLMAEASSPKAGDSPLEGSDGVLFITLEYADALDGSHDP
jgi:hypothetical protein